MSGWIKLHRKLKDHWLWKDANRLKWWIDILLEVNHESRKVSIKGEVIECHRGQSVRSEVSWANEWKVDRGIVRRFFKMLEDDKMITIFSHSKTTIITVCNYESYQDEQTGRRTANAQQTHSKRTANAHKQVREELEEGKNTPNGVGESAAAPQSPAKDFTDEQKKIFAGFKEWVRREAPQVELMQQPLTIDEYFKLTAEFGKIGHMLQQMHNKVGLTKKYLSTYHTCQNWLRMDRTKNA